MQHPETLKLPGHLSTFRACAFNKVLLQKEKSKYYVLKLA
jgi:hypothetical protein